MKDIEIWKPIKDYEGLYEVSNFGRIKRLERFVETDYRNQRRRLKEKILGLIKPGIKINPYFRVSLSKAKNHKNYRLHRLIAEAFIPNPDNLPVVNHKDGNKLNNSVHNLEWCTQEENEVHAKINGLKSFLPGEKSVNAKLNEKQVLEILESHKSGKMGVSELSKNYSITVAGIENIVYGRSWKHINRELI